MTNDVDAYPLAWPIGWPRAKHRTRARFARRTDTGAAYRGQRQVSLAEGRDDLLAELRRLGASHVIISSNARTGRDGYLLASEDRRLADPGAAVYFRLGVEPRVLACDRWDRLADNLVALAKHIEALRGQERWGVGSLAQAFAGYRALSAVGERKPWWQVLGFKDRPSSPAAAEAKWRELMRQHHPDAGGNANQAAELNAAWDEGRKEMGL